MLVRLVAAGIRCSYSLLHALSYTMPSVSKVLLGASSMLVNGTLVSRAGTALVAMAAHEHGVAVLVCCETYKFTERVLLDAICYNELGDPDALLQAADADQGGASLSDWRERPRLKLLNLMYDVTPMKYLTMVVTEAGVIPPTSVPVIIREDRDRAQLAGP
uniref:Translation initiation factor eIF2B subunit delta n=2 Tax=Emiliania huxleyi TaxID=2903 RepID=A0A6U8SGW5_EMIHU